LHYNSQPNIMKKYKIVEETAYDEMGRPTYRTYKIKERWWFWWEQLQHWESNFIMGCFTDTEFKTYAQANEYVENILKSGKPVNETISKKVSGNYEEDIENQISDILKG